MPASDLPAATHLRTCPLCEAMCGLELHVTGGAVSSIRGDAGDPFSRGHLCPKGVALADLHADPDRLRKPLRRTPSGWEEVGWDAALDEAARGLDGVRRAHGRDAVATYVGNPAVHDHGALLFLPLLLRSLGTRSRFSATSVDQLPHMVAAAGMFGHGLLLPVPDVDRTAYLLVLGANPLVSNGSLMTAPGAGERLAAIRKRGGKVVVVDPRRTETARAADEHHFIRPGTDALLLLALLHEVLARGERLGRLAPFSDGVEALRRAAAEVPPERAARHTGIDAPTTRRLAGELLEAASAAVYGRVGTSTQPFGGLCQWLVNALNAVTGNLDRPGGAMFTRPAFDLVGGPRLLAPRLSGFARRRSSVRGLPSFAGELPVAALAEEILAPGDGRIRALLTVAGNPVLSTPNGRQVDRALASLDFMVSIDPYLNETTRHARLILPPTTPLERSHYDLAFHALAVRNTARWSPPLFVAPPGTLADWRILLELKRRLDALAGGGLRSSATAWLLERLGPDGILDLGLRLGPYGAGLLPFRPGLSKKELGSHPHGVDLGPLEPCLPGRLATRGKRIDLAPEPFVRDLARLHASFPDARGAEAPGGAAAAGPAEGVAASGAPLLLVGRRTVRDNNSWMHNLPRLMRGATRCTLLVHPEDARSRGLADGDVAEVSSRVGTVRVPVAVTDEVMRGVVSLPHGYGHGREGVRLAVAARHAGESLNDLTDDQAVDALTGNAAFSGVPVRVTRAAAG